jgi:hypothetical protein
MRLETIILTLISSILGVNPPQEKTHIFELNTVFVLCVKEKGFRDFYHRNNYNITVHRNIRVTNSLTIYYQIQLSNTTINSVLSVLFSNLNILIPITIFTKLQEKTISMFEFNSVLASTFTSNKYSLGLCIFHRLMWYKISCLNCFRFSKEIYVKAVLPQILYIHMQIFVSPLFVFIFVFFFLCRFTMFRTNIN